GPGRPWLVGAIGVTSIVVASLSLLGALYLGMMLIPMLLISTGNFGPTGTTTQTTPANSITQADADVIVAALDSQATIAPADQKTLATALIASEFPLAPPADGKWTAAHVSGQISGYSTSNVGGRLTSFSFNTGGTLYVTGG